MQNVKAVVFDWAGTMVDFGSRAPMGAFVKAFAAFEIEISIEEARGPMGLPKREHIKALVENPKVAAQWLARYGTQPDDEAIDRIYKVFVPMNAAVVNDFAQLIPGALEVVTALREHGVKIGSTTGYVREIMEKLTPAALAQGYEPDNLVCAGDLSEGRPSPLMMYRCFADLGVYPPTAVVKVDDTEPGILEGVAAGTWTVGLALSGNLCGCSQEELAEMSEAKRETVRKDATAVLKASGADYVIDTVADLLPVINAIEERIARSERPGTQ